MYTILQTVIKDKIFQKYSTILSTLRPCVFDIILFDAAPYSPYPLYGFFYGVEQQEVSFKQLEFINKLRNSFDVARAQTSAHTQLFSVVLAYSKKYSHNLVTNLPEILITRVENTAISPEQIDVSIGSQDIIVKHSFNEENYSAVLDATMNITIQGNTPFISGNVDLRYYILLAICESIAFRTNEIIVIPNIPTYESNEIKWKALIVVYRLENPTIRLRMLKELGDSILHDTLSLFFQIQQLRSASAAIMARNMSHNIGSHVLARLSTKDVLKTTIFNKVSGSGLALEISKEVAADDVAHLNAFLRMRMDFVADVATAQIPSSPRKMSVLAEILPPFTISGLLWDNLCASHGLKRENILFHFNVISNTKTHIKIRAGDNKVERDNNDSSSVPEQIAMATMGIPNGTIGCQAFYCIIENFIRNTVKHSARLNQQNLELSMSLYEDGKWADNDRLMKFIIHDNWGGCKSKSGLIDDLNDKLVQQVIRDDGSLVASNRGLKEMKATAAYLRGLLPESVDDPDINPPLLKAIDMEGNLGYEIFVLRPKDLLVFTTGMNIAEDKRDLLKKQGVDTLGEVQEVSAKARDYPILLIANADDEILQLLNHPANSPDLPLRIIFQRENSVTVKCGSWQLTSPLSSFQMTFDELQASLQNGQGMAATACVWELWTRITCQDRPAELEIYEDKRLTQWNVESVSKLVQENDELDGSTDVVLYARHGHPKRGNPSVKFYEPYGKGVDPISFVLENPSQQEETRRGVVYQLMDAGLIPIVIIDERVQEAACSVKRIFPDDSNKGQQEDMTFWLSLMGIYIPPKEIDLESKQLNQQQLQNWLAQKGQQLLDGKFPSILIIHQGILDVIGLQDPEKAQQWIDSHKNLFSDVVITSGRGIPDNIPPRARFIPLSTVLLYTVERKSKFHLVQSLLAARRPKR